ncbi:MAG: Succinate--CoA ligase (ADP-forming) subunit alpha [Syntrophomonadaceae bacterium]|nr:Succinate--CoA ligase (ADP-forming) subunit alpha [Bacillota bacterium]
MYNNPLKQILHPKSLALVGAGKKPTKMGTLHALSIVKDGYPGAFYPIHPREETVFGRRAYKSVYDLPEVPDLAMLVVPVEQVLQLLDDFGKIGTKYAVIVTAGFRESGLHGQKQEDKLKEIAARYGIRFLGPNCIGFINSELPLNITVFPGTGKPGRLGMISQSGTYITQTLSYLKNKGIHFSKAISVGNEANIDIVDALEYLGQDEQTSAISLYIEGIKNGRRFIDVAQRITPYKPVLAQYVGGSGAGARAGMSHTGSMGGPEFLYEGIFKQAGVIQSFGIEDLYAQGWALATQPVLKGNRVAVITNSGGPGTAISHVCETGGLDVPRFSDELQHEIKQHVLSHASCANPVDMTFHLNDKILSRVIPEIIIKSGEVDGLILHGAMSHGFMREIYPRIKEMVGGLTLEQFLEMNAPDMSKAVELPKKYNFPLLVSSFFGREDNYTSAYRDNEIPVFDSPEKAAKAMATLFQYKKIRERKALFPAAELPARQLQVAAILDNAVRNGRRSLDEYESKQVLAAYGIPVTKEKLVLSEDEAVSAALSLGYPVVLKGCSPEIAHKTEKGLVHLSLKNESEVRQAYRAVTAVAQQIPVLVSEMVQGNRELLAGMTRFPGFGPCLMFGLGGIFAEAIRDFAFRAAPLSDTEAEEMTGDLLSARILGEYRGLPAANVAALSSIIRTLGSISLIHPEITELDINPLIISGSQPVAVDALVILSAEHD